MSSNYTQYVRWPKCPECGLPVDTSEVGDILEPHSWGPNEHSYDCYKCETRMTITIDTEPRFTVVKAEVQPTDDSGESDPPHPIADHKQDGAP